MDCKKSKTGKQTQESKSDVFSVVGFQCNLLEVQSSLKVEKGILFGTAKNAIFGLVGEQTGANRVELRFVIKVKKDMTKILFISHLLTNHRAKPSSLSD